MTDRVALVAADDLTDRAVERGREEERLRLPLDPAQDALHLRHEAHVGHLIRLVEDDEFDVLERQFIALEQVVQPSGRRDDDIDAGTQSVDLPHHGDAAVDRRQPEAASGGEWRERVRDLVGEFTRGHEHQRMRAAAAGGRRALDEREAERERLARAGLRFAAYVSAGERIGDGHGLDGKRRVDTGGVQRLHEVGRDAEGLKCVRGVLGGPVQRERRGFIGLVLC